MKKHKYDDNCTCQDCDQTFLKYVMVALDRGEKQAVKTRKKNKKNRPA